ncbi:MAG: YceI family protein [Saprospirales bacterium]|nr:YceI family protein [Saprospirales bacterium]
MKKHLSVLILLGISLFFISIAIQCKPSTDGKATETATTTDSTDMVEPETTTEAEAIAEETTTDVTTQAAPEATTAPVTKADPKQASTPAGPKKTAATSTIAETNSTTASAPAKPETKPTTETITKTETTGTIPPPENKTEKDTKTPPPAAAPVVSSFSVKSAKGLIEGTSNLHDWEMEVTKIDCKGSFQSTDNTINAIKNVEVKILVENIKSKEGKIMDQKTYKAFESEKNPYIIFTFSSADVKIDGSGNVTIAASGNLNMAGTNKTVPVTAKGKVLANGDMQLSISKKLNMTEYKMDPPTALMGTIKVGEEVEVKFDLVLAR